MKKELFVKKDRIKKRLLKILDQTPELKDIFLSSDITPEQKRKKIRYYLSDMLFATFEDNPRIPPLEWILTRNAVQVFKNIISVRNEKLAGHSLLQYIDDILHKEDLKNIKKPEVNYPVLLIYKMRSVISLFFFVKGNFLGQLQLVTND